MKQIFLIEKEDIVTSYNGYRTIVTTKEGIELSFSPEAVLELKEDIDHYFEDVKSDALRRSQPSVEGGHE